MNLHKFTIIYRVFLYLFIFVLLSFLIISVNSCEFEKEYLEGVQNILKYNPAKVDINIIDFQISIFPEVTNLFCLGKIKEVSVEKNLNNLLYEEQIINVSIYSSDNLTIVVYILFLLIQLTNLKIFRKFENHIVSMLMSILFNLYFVSNPISFFLFLFITQITIHFYFVNENKVIEFLSLEKNKNILFLLLFVFNIFIAYQMIFEEYFFIGSYLINYNYGFIRRGLIGTILLHLNLSTFLLLLSVSLILVILYSFYQYFLIAILDKNKNIFLNLVAFSPLVIFYQIVNTTHSVNSNLMGGEFIGLLAVAYAAWIKDHQSNLNLFLLFLLFNVSIYTHEINVLCFLVIHLILKNNLLSFFNLLSVSIFTYFYVSNYSTFKEKFIPLCAQFESLNIRENICLGGLSNATFEIGFNIKQIQNLEIVSLAFSQNNRSYIFSILFFIYFIFKLKLSKEVLIKSTYIVAIYIPVFIFAVDWGRWLNIIFSTLIIFYSISEVKTLKKFSKIDLLFYLILLFSFKHFGTRGVSFIDLQQLLSINAFMFLLLLFQNVKDKNRLINKV